MVSVAAKDKAALVSVSHMLLELSFCCVCDNASYSMEEVGSKAMDPGGKAICLTCYFSRCMKH